MSVLLDTSMGEIVIDLFTQECPFACENFLKLCKIKFYNGCLFYNVQPNYLVQSGDPTGTGNSGESIFGILRDDKNLGFIDELNPNRKLNKPGFVCMAHQDGKPNSNKSQFFITLRGDDLEHLDGVYSIFGEVAEGLDVLEKFNGLYCDGDGRPYQDVRIRHTYVLDDPYPDPLMLNVPPSSPEREKPDREIVKSRLIYSDTIVADEEFAGKTEEEIDMSIKRKEAYSRALVLEMTGDIPDVEAKPPKEVRG
jgi:peptidyl-prolyl cis-trans isomerase-like 4